MGDDEQLKVGTEVLATHESAEKNPNTSCSSNAEIEEDKKVVFTAKQSPTGKSKALKSESSEGTPRKRSELDEQCTDRMRRSPVQIKKSRVGNEIRKVKSDSSKAFSERKFELSLALRKMKSEPREDGSFKNSLQLVKAKTLAPRKIEHMNKSDSDKDLEGIEELKAITSNGDVEIKDISISLEDQIQKPKKVVIKEKKLLPRNERSPPISPVIKRQIPDNPHGNPSKIQSLADLIMWKDVSRSTFVFGIGSFAIISSSYTKDLNISLISVLSYLGLVYLGVSFISKSIIRRGSMDMDNINQEYVVGEEEAIWLVKLLLPYVNEFLVKLRGLFSGDPPTTMKLAVLLFIVARCGGSITIWKMTKLGFFGVFMVPKLCSSYSSHLAAYGSFWIRRFGDAWESCSHKKAVGFGILTLVWNQSSAVARIWGLFLLFVAFKYYHQHHSWIKDQASNQTSNSEYTNTTPRSTITQINKQI